MPAGQRVRREQILDILEMDARGFSQIEIARRQGLSHYTICRILKRVHDEVWSTLPNDVAAIKSRHAAKLEHAAMLCLIGFQTKTSDRAYASFLGIYREILEDIRLLHGISPKLQIQAIASEPVCGSDEVTNALLTIQALTRGEDPIKLGLAPPPDPRDDPDFDGDADDIDWPEVDQEWPEPQDNPSNGDCTQQDLNSVDST